MSAGIAAQIRAMEARIAQLERERRQVFTVPVVGGSGALLFKTCTIIYGTQFYLPSGVASGIYGLKYKVGLSTRTTVPSTPATGNMANTYDGLAWTSIGWVIVGPFTDSGGTFHAAKNFSAPNGQPILVYGSPFTINDDAGGTAPVFQAYSL